MKGNRNMRGPGDKTVLKDGTLGRLIRMIFTFYPALLPFTLACILVNAIITAIPSLFQQRIIVLIEQNWQSGDWAGVSAQILSLVLTLAVLYVLSLIAGDFYKVPITVAFMIASIYAICISGGQPLQRRIDTFSRGAGSNRLLLMLWIYVLAGAFAASAKV